MDLLPQNDPFERNFFSSRPQQIQVLDQVFEHSQETREPPAEVLATVEENMRKWERLLREPPDRKPANQKRREI